MTTQCKLCDRFEKKLKALHDARINLWRRGILTDDEAARLSVEESRTAEQLKDHQAAAHVRVDSAA